MTDWTRRTAIRAAATLALALPLRKPGAAAEEPGIGRLILRDLPMAPAGLRWRDGDGAEHGLADYAGRGVILNLWATWCGPCVAEMPSLAALGARVAADGIVVVPVSADASGAPAVRQFYAAHGITGLGIWLDPDGQAAAAAGVLGLPTTLIIDRRGREVARLLGAANWSAPGTVETLQALCER